MDCPFKVTFDIKLSKLQLFLVVLQEEMEVVPGDFLLAVKAGCLRHGLDAVLCLRLRQRAVRDLKEGPGTHREEGKMW